MKLRGISILTAGLGLLLAIGCLGVGEADRDFETVQFVNEINAPLAINYWRPFRAVKTAQLPPCESTQVTLDARNVEDSVWFFQARGGETSEDEVAPDALFFFRMTGEELIKADLTVHFIPDMASENTDIGRKFRNLPCP